MINLYNKYASEGFNPINGIYSDFDCRMIYSIVREYKPKKIIDFAPREGRTTSCILSGLLLNIKENNDKIYYYVFEKDIQFLNKTKEYVNNYIIENNLDDKFNVVFNENIIDSPILEEINDIDLLFIDANHDYILAKWYVDNLFNKVSNKGIIHIHDIYFNEYGNGWEDITMINHHKNHNAPPHPDYSNIQTMKNLYSAIFDKYYEGEEIINQFEGDVIKKFYAENENKFDFYSTLEMSKKMNLYHNFNCSLYLKKK